MLKFLFVVLLYFLNNHQNKAKWLNNSFLIKLKEKDQRRKKKTSGIITKQKGKNLQRKVKEIND